MKPASILKTISLASVLVAASAHADGGARRSSDSLPSLPASAHHASDRSEGLPNADGHKPGKGHGYGHEKGKGEGHDHGYGHGHDDDEPDSP